MSSGKRGTIVLYVKIGTLRYSEKGAIGAWSIREEARQSGIYGKKERDLQEVNKKRRAAEKGSALCQEKHKGVAL